MGKPNNCSCQCGETSSTPTKYDCVNGICIPVVGGAYDEPTCGGSCSLPPAYIDYGCVAGDCVPLSGGPYRNDPTCNNQCVLPPPPDPPPPGDPYYHYVLVNCENEEDVIYAKSLIFFWSPYGNVWKINDLCYRMVGENLGGGSTYTINNPSTTCEYCSNNGCYFTIETCSAPTETKQVLIQGVDIFDCDSYINKVFRLNNDTRCWRITGTTTSYTDSVNSPTFYNDCTACESNCPYYPCDPNGAIIDCLPGFVFDCNTCSCVEIPTPPDPDPTGACCYAERIDGFYTGQYLCEITTEAQCAILGGPANYSEWYLNQECIDESVECPKIGACCLSNGTCVDGISKMACDGLGGSWYPNTTCNFTPCFSPE